MPIQLTLNVSVSDEDIAVINHVVVSDPEQQPGESAAVAWLRRVWRDLGINAPRAVADKVARHRQSYLDAVAAAEASGQPYLNAAERSALLDNS